MRLGRRAAGLPVRALRRRANSATARSYSARRSFSPGASARQRRKYAMREPMKPIAFRPLRAASSEEGAY